MKKTFTGCLLSMIFLIRMLTPALAGTQTPLTDRHRFGVGLKTHYFDYKEPGIMEETGFMYGVVGHYTHHTAYNVMVHASVEYSMGSLDYDGHLQDGTPFETDTDDWLVECRGLIGYDIGIKGRYLITPYTGVGYRYWNDVISSAYGYEREIHYWYAPIGVKTAGPLAEKWTWGLTAEYDLFCRGTVKSHVSDADPAYNDPSLDQDFGEGYGVRCSLMFERALAGGASVSIEPFISYWDMQRSEVGDLYSNGAPIGHVVEPENETLSYGLSISLNR